MKTVEHKITFTQLQSAIESDDNVGFCLACGDEASQCEPDARNYKCESCGERRVFGAEQILIMGEFEDDSPEIELLPAEELVVLTPKQPRAMSLRQIIADQPERYRPVLRTMLATSGMIVEPRFVISTGKFQGVQDPDCHHDTLKRWEKIAGEQLNRKTSTAEISIGELFVDDDDELRTVCNRILYSETGELCCEVSAQHLATCRKHSRATSLRYSPDNGCPAILGFRGEQPVFVLAIRVEA